MCEGEQHPPSRPWTAWAWGSGVQACAAGQRVAAPDLASASVGRRRPRLQPAVLSPEANCLLDSEPAWPRLVPWPAQAGGHAEADRRVAAEEVVPLSPAACARSPVSAS